MESTVQRWEYHAEECRDLPTLKETLNKNGQQGWELVSVVFEQAPAGPQYKTNRDRRETGWRAFFKRPQSG